MSSACRDGHAADTIEPRLWLNRLSAIFWNSGPKTGIFSFAGSTTSRTLACSCTCYRNIRRSRTPG